MSLEIVAPSDDMGAGHDAEFFRSLNANQVYEFFKENPAFSFIGCGLKKWLEPSQVLFLLK